jgi:uncharacterized OB-fold protein
MVTAVQRFGLEGPSHNRHDECHWDGLKAGELRIQRCGSCREWIWIAQPLCPSCHTFDPVWEAVAPEGVVYAWTRTHRAFHPSAEVPYTTVLVELPQAGNKRILGLYRGTDDPVIGARVVGEFEPAPDEDSWPLIRWSAA